MTVLVIIGIALGIYRYRKIKAVTEKGSPSEAHERNASDEMSPVIDGSVVYEMEDRPQVSEMRGIFGRHAEVDSNAIHELHTQ